MSLALLVTATSLSFTPGARHLATPVRPRVLSPAVRIAMGPVGAQSRRSALHLAAALALGAAVAPDSATAADVDYVSIASEVAKLVRDDPDKGPTLVRLAWHSSGTYDKVAKDGGSGPGTIRFKEELAHGANAGLASAVDWLEPIKKKNPGISNADLFTLAGVAAIKEMRGPVVPWSSGRIDGEESQVTPDGRLPAADKGSPKSTAQGLRDVFYRMGFNDQEIVALSGAHALGRCHPDASGYKGPWTPTPTTFSNAYFSLLLNLKWTPKEWDGPMQYEDPSGKLMMLPSDLVLIEDPSFKKYAKMYAGDAAKFNADFAQAFAKLLELGTSGLTPTAYS
eukprot:CAMPEP_0185185336 /NCGR_PEP_ID=MMETSP1140-20130426/3216_1 /TAXON_ID=298111 /ORGANISM="Pavlova sp., Strain CCMP459" /LENGTH=337 /DNA_ID=CAMNT_0027751507 /DNA_START=13 /DNA_END=1026 /DNA_ORIENTATION=-